MQSVTDDGLNVVESFLYDDNGNLSEWTLTGVDTRTFRYDPLDRLVAIDGTTADSAFEYDPFGRRIEKVESTTVRYQYDGLDVVAEYDGNNTLRASYVFGPGIDEPLEVRRDGLASAFHADGLGSVVGLSRLGDPGTDAPFVGDWDGNGSTDVGALRDVDGVPSRSFHRRVAPPDAQERS